MRSGLTTSSSSVFTACLSERWTWVIRTTASARKPPACWPDALGLRAGDYVVTFQSRFGRAEWLQPYTAPTLRNLAANGCSRVDVICPGFVADCLETLEEIAIEAQERFLSAGGKQFHYIACLNDAPAFIAALADLVQQQMQGWPVPSTLKSEAAVRDVEAQKSRERARLMGAGN